MEKTSRSLVKGFLKAKGTTIVNELGEEIILTGWGIGNWLLCEGYMWMVRGDERFDRPRNIERTVRQLAGTAYADKFWMEFRQNYITREDIRLMAEAGYNSIRIPFNWRILMEEEPGLIWKEEGFDLLDKCIDWCEEFGIYVFLDLHGAPGGQTGANIDDSVDNLPRLFMDKDSWDKCIALWVKIAHRYKDRWIVGGYDLLNEPIRPESPRYTNCDHLVPKLVQFYDEAIAEIRKIDTRHLISIEGHHWSTDATIFYKKYDENMVIHFHRYGCYPTLDSYKQFLEVSERLDAPLWLGETGENYVEWFTAMYPLAVDLGIGYNLWPWKKMECLNSPYSVKKPEGWEKITGYIQGGVHPGYEEAQKILDEYLENIKVNNCTENSAVNYAVFRKPGCRVRATDFDTFPGKGASYSGMRKEGNIYDFRTDTGMKFSAISDEPYKRRFGFDCGWDRLVLELEKGEYAAYSIYEVSQGNAVTLEIHSSEAASVSILQDSSEICRLQLDKQTVPYKTQRIPLASKDKSAVKVQVLEGKIQLAALSFDT